MRVKAGLWLAVVLCLLGTTGRAQGSGGDLIWPKEATYMLVGVPVAVNAGFTAVDVALALQSRAPPRAYAGLELGVSSAQLLVLALLLPVTYDNPYVVGYAAWTAGLWTHGLVSVLTTPDPTRPLPRGVAQRGLRWAVAASPVVGGRLHDVRRDRQNATSRLQGGSVTVVGVW